MNWEQKAVIVCTEKGLEIVSYEGGYVFVKNSQGKIQPVDESVIATWFSQQYDHNAHQTENVKERKPIERAIAKL